MKIRKIEINSDLAHFKKPFATKAQYTYKIPPISTVIGILKNLFSEDISNFVFGYTFNSGEKIFKDIHKIYKEVNFNVKLENDRYDNGIWVSDIAEVHYLVDPTLIIYTNLRDKMLIHHPLNLGKTDCLARVLKDEYIDLIDIDGEGFEQFTTLDIEAVGQPINLSVETVYNGRKGYYDIFKKHVRLTESFKYDKYYDEEAKQNIFLWKYKQRGEMSEFR